MAASTVDKPKIITKWQSELQNDEEGTFAKIYCHVEIKDDESSSNKDVDIGNADKYFFTVRRYKDKATREEHISIKVYEVITNDVCAEIEKTNIIELESKLLNLRVYGVLLGRKHFPKVRQVIEKAYPGLTPRTVDNSTLVTPEVVERIYMMFVRYIDEVGIEVGTNGLYNIPVDEFKEYLSDTEYSKYKYSDIRQGLAEFTKEIEKKALKGTKCSYGRNDNTIAKGDKRIKVISFVPAVVESYRITKLPET